MLWLNPILPDGSSYCVRMNDDQAAPGTLAYTVTSV